MAQEIILAGFRNIKHEGPTKFCHGKCQAELPRENFYARAGNFCKQCSRDKSTERSRQKKAEREMYGI
jgi:hypothetical protein